MIAKHCPLKQGLRLHFRGYPVLSLFIAKHCPLKQGLRRLVLRHGKRGILSIAKHCPLKQGLI